MKLINKSIVETLEVWSKDPSKKNGFPFDHHKNCYYKRYSDLSEKLNRDIHPMVGQGSTLADGGLLTDHGPEHIETVIRRAGHMLDGPGTDLQPYELYLLLVSIHFHDVANILGRKDHEKNISEIMELVKEFFPDTAERNCIQEIAGVHGGKIDDDKDTISKIPITAPISGVDVRMQALAAIVRFADELADDSFRTNPLFAKLDLLPDGSHIFHKYAECLNSVMVRTTDSKIELHFNVNIHDLTRRFSKQNKKNIGKTYLLDEILERTFKMHQERIYCNRFMYQFTDLRTIDVKIQTSKKDQSIGEELPEFAYRLEESGYPELANGGIYGVCPQLKNWQKTGKKLTGTYVSKEVKEDYRNA